MVDRIDAQPESASRDAVCLNGLARFACAGGPVFDDRHDNFVMLILKFQDQMHSLDFVHGAEFDGGGGAEEIHRFGRVWSPGLNVLEIKSTVFFLNKNAHNVSSVCAPECIRSHPTSQLGGGLSAGLNGRKLSPTAEDGNANFKDTKRLSNFGPFVLVAA
jgi:hypothetical protein